MEDVLSISKRADKWPRTKGPLLPNTGHQVKRKIKIARDDSFRINRNALFVHSNDSR